MAMVPGSLTAGSNQGEYCILINRKFHLLESEVVICKVKKVTFSRTANSIKGFDFTRVMVLASREESFFRFLCVHLLLLVFLVGG